MATSTAFIEHVKPVYEELCSLEEKLKDQEGFEEIFSVMKAIDEKEQAVWGAWAKATEEDNSGLISDLKAKKISLTRTARNVIEYLIYERNPAIH